MVRWRRRVVPALGLALVVSVAPLSPVATAQVPGGAPVAPADVEGTDPVLDEVEVDPTGATRDAEGAYDAATTAQEQAEADAATAEADRTTRAESLATADGGLADAEAALTAAKAALVVEQDLLATRKATQRTRRAELVVQQEELRQLVVGVFISAPTDEFAWLSDPDHLSDATQREAVRERTSQEQSRRVDEATTPWEEARDATAEQQDAVDDADAAVDAADLVLLLATTERDRAAQLLALAETLVADRLATVATAVQATQDAALTRRAARMTATVSHLDLSLVVLHAYWVAAGNAPCTLPWWLLAGVGKVETRHGTYRGSSVDARGDISPHILGIALDGRPGVAAIGDTDGGVLDGDTTWDRAVGPMQFIPGTWRRWAADGNADGAQDPHNIYDAAAAAANYLCFGRASLANEADMRGALLSYNQSVPYGTKVLAEGTRYRDALNLPDVPPAVELVATTAGD